MRHLRQIKIANDLNKVKIQFEDVQETAEDIIESVTPEPIKFSTEVKRRPHKDLVDSMKKLRKYALDIIGIEVESKQIGLWTVSGLKLTGDVTLEQSRVVMTLAKKIEPGAAIVEIKTPQIAMFGDTPDEKMNEVIMDVIEEVWSYLNGKSESGVQMAIFPQKQEA